MSPQAPGTCTGWLTGPRLPCSEGSPPEQSPAAPTSRSQGPGILNPSPAQRHHPPCLTSHAPSSARTHRGCRPRRCHSPCFKPHGFPLHLGTKCELSVSSQSAGRDPALPAAPEWPLGSHHGALPPGPGEQPAPCCRLPAPAAPSCNGLLGADPGSQVSPPGAPPAPSQPSPPPEASRLPEVPGAPSRPRQRGPGPCPPSAAPAPPKRPGPTRRTLRHRRRPSAGCRAGVALHPDRKSTL